MMNVGAQMLEPMSDPIVYNGSASGRYYRDRWRYSPETSHQLGNIVTRKITPEALTFIAHKGGDLNERVYVYIHDAGIKVLRGQITRVIGSVLTMAIAADENERAQLAAKILWLDQRANFRASDNRKYPRFQPKNPNSSLTFPGGKQETCSIVDISPMGAGVMCETQPKLNSKVILGQIMGHVRRHTDYGFGMQFSQIQNPEILETLAGTTQPAASGDNVLHLMPRQAVAHA